MSEIISQLYFPKTLNEFFSSLNRNSFCSIMLDGVALFQDQHTQKFVLPKAIITLENIDELHRIDRTDRFLDIGIAVNLNRVLNLKNFVPSILNDAIKNIATLPMRNLITIGSCICRKKFSRFINAAMIALDARYEMRSSTSTRWVQAADFIKNEDVGFFSNSEIFTRIRLPLNQWDYFLFKSLKPYQESSDNCGIIVFLAHIQNDILSQVRIVFSGSAIIYDKDIESTLSGKKLPLDIKEASGFIDEWKKHLVAADLFFRDCLINFIESAIMHFVD
ncbi:hypothetical protein FACS1894190_10510 [Spirochaetia bacterium]|nr:hypothetical protein FACS1894190_10510 [Spirochaetia bacterium]